MNNYGLLSLNFKKTKHLFMSKTRQSQKPATLKTVSFHESTGWVLLMAQFCCLMPVIGVLGDIRNVRFKMFSFRTISCIVLIVMAFIEGFLVIKHAVEEEVNFNDVQHFLFIAEFAITGVLFIILARNWGNFVRFWKIREECFLREPYAIKGMNLKRKICTIGFTIYVLSLIEHTLFWISTIASDYKQYTVCKFHHIPFIEFLFEKEWPHVFVAIPFQYYTLLPTLWVSFCSTICWNFIDILIIITSVGLASRFEQINKRITIFYNQAVSNKFWLDIRSNYVNLVQILEKVNQEMSLIIIMSCACNLFSICYRLFNSVNDTPHPLKTLYFWYCLIYLICRTVCVLYFAASVNDTSRKPLRVLRDVPTKFWNSDVQRFIDLVSSECVALSGNKFFFLTRKLILAMAGTVVTYELVLMQEVDKDLERKSICNITRFNFTPDKH